jgi:hypothetical protein
MSDEDRDPFQLTGTDPTDSRSGGGGAKVAVIGAAVVLLVVVAGIVAVWLMGGGGDGGDEQVVAVPTPTPVPATPTPTAEERRARELAHLELETSDETVREAVSQVTTHRRLSSWLAHDRLLRRAVAVAENIANGVSPRVHVPFLAPDEPFSVIERDGRVYIDPRSYDRYDALADAVTRVDVETAADLYRELKPLLDQAYREQGYPSGDVGELLVRTAREVLSTPVVEGDVEVEEKVVTYEFADPALESLNPVQRHLLRMGPDNVTKIQNTVSELMLAVGVAPEELPTPRHLTAGPAD